MKTAFFTGTFDPPTLGHLDIIERSQSLCDKLYVGIGINSTKESTLFSTEERKAMLVKICKRYSQIEVVTFAGLTIEFAKLHHVNFFIRGLRAFSDFEYEFDMALANRKLSNIDTVFLMADERVGHIRSTLIRELGKFKSRLHDFIPAEIESEVFKKLSEQ